MNNIINKTHINHKQNDERVHLEEEQLENIREERIDKKRERQEKEERQVEEYYKDKLNKVPSRSPSRNELKYSNNHLYNPNSNMDLDGINDKIKRLSKKMNTQLEDLISNFLNGKYSATYDDFKLLLKTKFNLSDNECNRFLKQIIDTPINDFKKGSQNKQTNSSKILIEDFISLLKRSYDFPNRPTINTKGKYGVYSPGLSFNNKSYKEMNEYEKERELLEIYKNKNEYSQYNHSQYNRDNQYNPYDNLVKPSLKPNPTTIQEKYILPIREIIFKLVSNVRLFKINLYQVLCDNANDGRGIIKKDKLREALNEIMNLNLNMRDINGLLEYFKLESREIDIQRFVIELINSYDLLERKN